MSAYWAILTARVDALSRRERLLVLFAVLAVVFFMLNALLLDPVAKRARMLEGQLAGDRAQVAALRQQLQLLAATPVADPDAEGRARLEVINRQLQQVDAALEDEQRDLVSPDRMAGLLEDILKKNGQLKLLSLRTLSPDEKAKTGDAGAKALPVFRHGVELKVQGRYLDLLNYLRALEGLSWHMLWGNVALSAEPAQLSTLTVTIYTLSLDRAWLSI